MLALPLHIVTSHQQASIRLARVAKQPGRPARTASTANPTTLFRLPRGMCFDEQAVNQAVGKDRLEPAAVMLVIDLA
jgi:hypothetical protein